MTSGATSSDETVVPCHRRGEVPISAQMKLHIVGYEASAVACLVRELATLGIVIRDDPHGDTIAEIVLFRCVDASTLSLVSRRAFAAEAFAVTFEAHEPKALLAVVAAGARDVVSDPSPLRAAAQVAARIQRLQTLRSLIDAAWVARQVIGPSSVFRRLLLSLAEMAAFSTAPVLLLGETGTGKEQLARLLHAFDGRPERGDLVVVDCTTLSPELSGSELFGHERGAFTGAVQMRDGALAQAHGGTLFLDEIGELPLPLQAQLLRAVQEQKFKRIGSNVWQRSDFRLVCATHRDLSQEVEAGHFRSDLYFRIAGLTCQVPPLRERREDILPLARHFLETLLPSWNGELDPAVQAYLIAREYPGNVRDLRQTVMRLCMRHAGPGPITVGCIPPPERLCVGAWPDPRFQTAVRVAVDLRIGLKEISRAATVAALEAALERENGNLAQAARRLGITPRALQLRRANGALPGA